MSWTASSVSGCFNAFKVMLQVLPSKDGLKMLPNRILVNLRTCRSVSTNGFFLSFTHRNLVHLYQLNSVQLGGKTFSISAVNAIRFVWNLMSSPHMSSRLNGPLYKHSFRLRWPFLLFKEAS